MSDGEHVRGELVEDAPQRWRLDSWRGSSPGRELLELVPAIGRLTAAAWLRSAAWGVEAGLKLGTRVVQVVTPQEAIDVRSSHLIGLGSQLVARGLNMMGTEAGCRHPERVPAYLNNLHRLGLIWLSTEPLDDPGRYQVLEAQPKAIEAIRKAGRARTVQRTIRLTAFGSDFCQVCLPLEEVV